MNRVSAELDAGDIVLMGNGGSLSHVGVYLGSGELIHSVATDRTGRGVLGSALDALRRPFHGLTGYEERTGVIRESLGGFFDRFERDTYVVLRRSPLSVEQIHAGLAALTELIGKPYDYDFNPENDEYYCSELVVLFLEAADGSHPQFETVAVEVPGILEGEAIEPISFLKSGHFSIILANQAAQESHREWLGEVPTP